MALKLAGAIFGLMLLAWALLQLHTWFWMELDDTELKLDIAVCESIGPGFQIKRREPNQDFILHRIPDEEAALLIDGDLLEFKDSHPEPLAIKIHEGSVTISGVRMGQDQIQHLLLICHILSKYE